MKATIKKIKTIQCQVPYLIPLTLAYSVFWAVQPFIVYQFIGLIVNGLYAGKDIQEIILSAGILAFIILLLDSAVTLLANKIDFYTIELTYKQDLTLAKAAMDMEYSKLESHEIQILLENIKQSKFQRGDSWAKQVDLIKKLYTSIFTIVAAVVQILKITFDAVSNTEEHILYMPLIILCLIGILVWISILSAKNGMKHGKNIFSRFSEVAPINRVFGFYRQEIFPNYRYGKDIRIYEEQELINYEFNETKSSIRIFMEKIGNEEARFRVKNTILSSFLLFVTYIFVGFLAYYRIINIGTVVIFLGVITKFLEGISVNILTITELSENQKFLQQYFDFINCNVDFYKDENNLSNKGNENGDQKSVSVFIGDILNGNFEIEFHHVSFKYPNAKKWALNDISFKIKQGEHIAIVGENGSGKTTCVRLLCRLYQPTSGVITINGVDIQKINFNEYIDFISAIFQDFELFSIKLYQTIAASDQADIQKVEKVLGDVDMQKRVEAMQNGIHTYMNYDFDSNGVELSGGEAQKIAISKVLYKDSPCCIMDEPTSALDPMAEADIFNQFDTLLSEKTLIFISHRLSSCIFCDRIFVFQDGELKTTGIHANLLKESKQYKRMWDAQAKNYK